MSSSQFKLSTKHNKNSIFGEKYQQYLLTDSIAFLKLMMILLCVNALLSLLVFIIEGYGTIIIALMSSLTCLNFILIFQIHRLKPYIQSVFAILYMLAVNAQILIILFDQEIPLFTTGYAGGILLFGIIQFCNPKLKLFFVLATPWLFLAFTNIFFLAYLHYIGFALIASSLLGLLTYQFDAKQKLLYTQSVIIKNQQEIIKQFTNENLFAISYNERDRQFKLEFSNSSFENRYTEDVKQILRTYQVVFDLECTNQKKNIKTETLEEYLFSYNQEKTDDNQNSYFNLKIKNIENQQLQDIYVLRTYFHQPIFVISIKQNLADLQLEKHENKLKKLQEITISILSETGENLQSQYHNLNKLIMIDDQNKQNLCKLLQSDILRVMNHMKNYLIYFQSHKLQVLQASIKSYQFQVFGQAILSYFQIQSRLKNRLFLNFSQLNSSENYIMKNNQGLLTQILINVFNVVIKESQTASTIRFSVTFDENQTLKQSNLTISNKLCNSSEISQITILQFKFAFTSDHEIKILDNLLCKRIDEACIEAEPIIIASVNYLILRMIGPYNEIYTRSHQTLEIEKYQYEVFFYVYTDQTKLDSSFIKQMKFQRII